jgi:hypothetical protein
LPLRLKLTGVVGDKLQHRPKILQIEQEEAIVIRNLEHDREDALLRGIEPQQPAEQQRTQIRHRRADRHAPVSEDVPKDSGIGVPFGRRRLGRLQPVGQLGRQRACSRHPGQVAFDVGQETGTPIEEKRSARS